MTWRTYFKEKMVCFIPDMECEKSATALKPDVPKKILIGPTSKRAYRMPFNPNSAFAPWRSAEILVALTLLQNHGILFYYVCVL